MHFPLIFTTATLVTLAAAMCFPTTVSAQNLVQNPGFESGNASWTLIGNASASPYASYVMTPTAAFGTGMFAFNAADLAPNAVLSQNLATIPGQVYSVAFVYGNYATNTGGGKQQVVAAAINTTNAALLGSVTATDSVPGSQTAFSSVMKTTYTFAFTATGAQTTLRFTDSTASTTISSDGILDNVSAVAVPEVGTLALFAVPLAGVVVIRRRRAS